jgi:hypothetical protein
MEVAAERCAQCGCTIEAIPTLGVWNPEVPGRPFDWTFALVTFVMSIEEGECLYTDTIHRWRPGYVLKEGELEQLRAVELLVRSLWSRYAPPAPEPAGQRPGNLAAENAEVDEYEARKNALAGVLLRLAVTDEWQTFFPTSEHHEIKTARHIVIEHGGHLGYQST